MRQAVKGLSKLKDPSLLKNQAYLNGAWVDAEKSSDVTNFAAHAV